MRFIVLMLIAIDPSHIADANSFYNEITQCLRQASDTAFSKHNSSKASVKPGWSDYVAELYSTSRDVAKLLGGRDKATYLNYIIPRKQYLKFALRFI